MGGTAERALTSGATVGDVPVGAATPRTGRVDLGAVPAGLRLRRVALVSPRCGLGATAYEPASGRLHRVVDLPDGARAVAVEQSADGRLTASWGGPALDAPQDRTPASADADDRAVVAELRRVLALDLDLAPLYAALRPEHAYRWVEGEAGGRALRGASVWEDVALTLLEARTTLAGAQAMARHLLTLTLPGPLGDRGFPTPEAVAGAGAVWLRDEGRLGFRAAGVARLAEAAADAGLGDLDDPARPDADVERRLLSLPGVGAYSVAVLLGLLGRPRPLTADRWALEQLGAATTAELAARYADLGPWAGTAAWLDLTRHR